MTVCGMLAAPARTRHPLRLRAGGSYGSLSHALALRYARARAAVQCREASGSARAVSFPLVAWVLDHSEAKLGARLVLLALAEHAHDDGSNAFPKIETLMRRSRLSDRGVRDALTTLEADGMIVRTGKRGRTWVFTIVGPFNAADSAAFFGTDCRNKPAESAGCIGNQELEPQETLEASLGEDPAAPPSSTPSRSNGGADRTLTEPVADETKRDLGRKPAQVGTGSVSVRKRDPIWDALEAIFGPAPAGMERGRWNAAAKSLRADGATAEQVTAAADAYPRVFSGCAMTPTALAANWTTLTRARDGPGPRRTGWRYVRGTHAGTYVQDPEGTDQPPKEHR